jgi:shikimate dehydrogenase
LFQKAEGGEKMTFCIDGSTSIIGLIGNPVSHSISPLIHNTLFKELDLNYVYLPFEVRKEHLKEAVIGLKYIGVKGFNITIPYKEKIISLLDDINKEARFVGAVNTVTVDKDKLYGYNTDVTGFSESLEKYGIHIKNRRICILGNGGAARAVIVSAALDGAEKIYLIGRNYDKVRVLADEFEKKLHLRIKPVYIFDNNLQCFISQSDIIINTTSVGMKGKADISLLSEEMFCDNHKVIDIVYNPPYTKLLLNAKKRGCNVLNGTGMLVHQALHSFEIWTGQKPSSEIIYSKLKHKNSYNKDGIINER